MTGQYVVGVGAANVDVHGHSRNNIIMRDSNPGRMNVSAGGVTRNILENLSRLGVKTALLSAVGDDIMGEKIKQDSAAAGIDVSSVMTVCGVSSSAYISILDSDGDMAVALSDMSILKMLDKAYLDSKRALIQNAGAVICDPSLPSELMEYLVTDTARGIPVFVDTVSTSYARTIKSVIGRYHTIKPNRIELAELADVETDTPSGIEKASEKLLNLGCKRVITSLGADGCYYADSDGLRLSRALSPEKLMRNATGAGDAFMAGCVAAFLDCAPIEAALDFALACGKAALRSDETINPAISRALVAEIINEK